MCDDFAMSELLVMDETAVRQALPLGELAEALSEALISLANGTVSVPARIAAHSHEGLLAAMPGYVPGLGLGAKVVSVYPANPLIGLPAHQALIAVFDEETGAPVALMDGTYITAIRTAMTSALAARALTDGRVQSLAVIGAGVQAKAHLTAFSHLLAPSDIRVVSRHASKAAALAELYPNARATGSIREAVYGTDTVCCCTDAGEAVVESEWIIPGMFVSSVGSGAELPPDLLDKGRVFVESRSATLPPPAGAIELQGRDPTSLVEIGTVLAGREEGRVGDGEIAIFKSTGHAVEDLAAASVVISRARDMGIGVSVTM